MDKTELIQKHTQQIVNEMVPDAKVTVTEEEDMHRIHIEAGENAPNVIGRHGETIRALQKILEVIIYNKTEEQANLIIDVNDYREKQQERLEYIAAEAAQKVVQRGSASYLRGFSSFERRIMHEYVTKNFPDLKSYSIGEGRDRRMVIDTNKGGQPENSDDAQPEKNQNSSDESILNVEDIL